MTLTPQQIQDLFHFTERHYVEHYDVQVEIVDHLATAIEASFEKNPNQVFEQVLDNVYRSFGPMGVSGFLDSIQEKVFRKQQKSFNKEFLSYFIIPRLFLTLIFMIVLNLVFTSIDGNVIKYAFIIPVLAGFIYVLADFFVRKQKLNKPLVAWGVPLWMSGAGVFIQLPNLFLKDGSWLPTQTYYPELMAILTGLVVLHCFAGVRTLRNVYENLLDAYPEAFAK